MARSLRILNFSISSSFSSLYPNFFFVLLGISFVAAITAMLCVTHQLKSRTPKKRREGRITQSSEKKLLSKINSSISDKAYSMVKKISWKKLRVEDDEDDEAVWRKEIIMGEKCRPWDFSGKILYDANGNLVADSGDQEQSRRIAS